MELPKIQSRDEYDRKSPPGKIRINVNDCPFCNILDDKSVIIWEGERWYLVYNIFPYSGNHQHIMAIPKNHIFYGRDLSRKYWEELEDIYKVVQDFY